MWKYKKKSNKGVSNDRLDLLYDTARGAGAIGGKVMGAGGGGHMLFAVLPAYHQEVIEALGEWDCKHISYDIDWNGVEARIV